MSISNHAIQPNLVEIGCLELQHLEDSVLIDLIRSFMDFLCGAICAAEASGDKLLAVFVQEVKGGFVRAHRNFDQLCKSISNLRRGQGTEETKIEECVNGGMVGSQAILIIPVIDSDFDRHRRVNEADNGRRYANVIRVSTISCTCESGKVSLICLKNSKAQRRRWGVP